ncbi:hypothetical protein QBC32DRAFT_205489 [Pseudoneurospora amorphoporcata]|uniref:Uncharacterized protein n=1 Tax=Pseudoneurospora amorphoporcata TaxID=241081 RepID=A0AAN6P2A7_9PEZI|nr:hypothetical protein QBC32DRAFT_205489 [Pseudoneurospora amorphoporcata]
MRAPTLATFIVVTLVMAGISEFLAQRSQREGALALSDCSECLSGLATFGYLYAPTIVSVLYGLVWTWIDLDIRRIQPWLELSRPEGATADSSLLLDYPSSFLAFVPFSAGKRRHWPVFFSGIASMMIFWGTTPLLGAIFGVKPVAVVTTAPKAMSATLPSLEDQTYKIDTSMLYGTYGVAWLNQSYPAFTTSDYAVVPFAPAIAGSRNRTEESWTATTQMLSTDLDCWPASITTTLNDRSFVFDNERGCNTTVAFFQTSPFPDVNNVSVVLYIGYHGDAHLDYQLKQPKCSTNTSHQFLAVYAEQTRNSLGNVEYKNITGSFCETRYHKQQVSVTVSADTNKPLDGSLSYLGLKEQLGEDEFNSTAFEFLLNTGKPFTTYGNFEFPTPVRDFAACTTLEPFGALSKKDVAWPVTNMVNTALGLSDRPVKQWRDSKILEDSFRIAHKAAFAVAVSNLLSPVQVSNGEDVSVKRTMYGVVVNRTIAYVFEGLLLAVAFLIAAVWYTSARAESNLSGDPATIGFTLRALQRSRSLLGRFAMEDCTGAPELKKSLLNERFNLELDNAQSILDINSSFRPSTPESELKDESSSDRRRDIKYAATQPRDLHPATGLIVISIILTALAVLAYLKKQEQVLNGLSRPTENFTILQILENYIPTVFSTLLEPFLVVLTRIICILQPFNELRKGRRGPENTLEARYTSLPPQLVLWRALKSQHFLLVSLCAITLLANVVTVSLGGIFNEAPVAVEHPLRFAVAQRSALTRDTIMDPVYTEHVTSGHTYDHFYATWSNLSTNTTLPPWTTHKHVFLPIVLPQETQKEGLFRTQLRGFGVDSKCTPLASSKSASESYANLTYVRGGREKPTYLFRRDNGSWTECFPQMSMTGPDPAGRSAREFASGLQPDPLGPWSLPPSDKSGFCEDKIALGWLRINSNDSSEIIQSTFMTCEATLKTAIFNVTFDHMGRILNSTQAGEFDDIELFMTRNQSQTLVREANGIVTNVGRIGPSLYPLGWHNTSITTDWFNYLLKFYLNSTDLVDPQKEVPDVEALIPAVQDLYQRLFAVLLGQNLPMFESVDTANGDAVVAGVRLGTETRIFLDDNAFIISVVILSLNVVVLTAVYWRRKKSYLPRFPSTIGSLIGYVAASRAVRQYGEDYDVKTSTYRTMSSFKSFSQPTYSFGRYIGVDGNLHLGIEMDPFVVTIDETMREERKRWYKRGK